MPHTSFFNYNITRPYQTTYYFALEEIFTSYMSIRRGPYLVPDPHQAKKQCHTPNLFNYNITRPYQITYYFAIHKIFTSYTSIRRGPYLIPGPTQAKIQCHTPNFLTTISRDPTKQHIILPYAGNIYILHGFKEGPLFGS